MATLLRIFPPDLLDLLDLTARAGLLGDGIKHLVLIPERFQIFLPYFFRLLILFHSISPTYHRSSYSILDGPVGKYARAVLRNIRHILLLRHSCLLAKHAIALGTVVLVRLFLGSLVGVQDTST